jgi:hypothetical protein
MNTFGFVGTYEVREIRAGWQHPKDASGRYIPLLPFGYQTDGERAPADEMMPPPLGDILICAYEAVTEGTPISPGFPDTAEGRLALCGWLAEHRLVLGSRKVDVEAWTALLFGDAVITAEGVVLVQP